MLEIFEIKSLWKVLDVDQTLVNRLYHEYLGIKDREIASRTESIKLLSQVILRIQDEMIEDLKTRNKEDSIRDLYKILDEVYCFYIKQRKTRLQMQELGIDLENEFIEYRNMAKNIIDSANLWIENSLLFQENLKKGCNWKRLKLNQELCVKMYIYGATSQALSLISMSRKFGEEELFTGLRIQPNKDNAIEPIKHHPVIYYNYALIGNQKSLVSDDEFKKVENSIIGKGFNSTYKIRFLNSLRLLDKFKEDIYFRNRNPVKIMDKACFVKKYKSILLSQ